MYYLTCEAIGYFLWMRRCLGIYVVATELIIVVHHIIKYLDLLSIFLMLRFVMRKHYFRVFIKRKTMLHDNS